MILQKGMQEYYKKNPYDGIGVYKKDEIPSDEEGR